MVEYHFTRADYMKDAFYAVMVGLAFAALIILEAKYPVFPGFFSRSVGIMQN